MLSVGHHHVTKWEEYLLDETGITPRSCKAGLEGEFVVTTELLYESLHFGKVMCSL